MGKTILALPDYNGPVDNHYLLVHKEGEVGARKIPLSALWTTNNQLSAYHQSFTAEAGQTVWPMDTDPQKAALMAKLHGAALILVIVEGDIIGMGDGENTYQVNEDGQLVFNSAIDGQKIQIIIIKWETNS